MSLKSAVRVAGYIMVLLGMGCQMAISGSDNTKTFYVASAMRDGMGVGPMTCLQIKETPSAAYTMFYSSIRGFDYVPGFEYQLKVRVTERDRVPADASKYIYTLEEVVSKTPDGLALERGIWELKTYQSVSGTMDPRVQKSMVNMKISEGKISGSAGANHFFGGVKIDGTSIKILTVGSSMMMGTPELMAQEDQFLKLLQLSTRYQIVGDELRLQDENSRVVLIFIPRIEPGLTSNVWKATGVNNGKGGVSSLLQGSTITAEFTVEGRVSGTSGCNSYSGGYEQEGTSIEFSPMAGTRKMCAEPAGIMEQEMQFLQALEKSAVYSIHEGRLELRDDSGSLQASFSALNE